MIQGSSIDPATISEVREAAKGFERVMVFLDSMHTHQHVLEELRAYGNLVSVGSYCVVFDTFVEDMPENLFPDRPWEPGNNPKTAANEFLKNDDRFCRDPELESKLQVTVAPGGFLLRVK